MSIPLTGAGREDAAAVACAHCGQPVIGRGTADAAGKRYCCTGCAAAADLVRELGLDGAKKWLGELMRRAIASIPDCPGRDGLCEMVMAEGGKILPKGAVRHAA